MEHKKERTPSKQWVRKRHRVIYTIAYPVIKALCHIAYPKLTIDAFREGRDGAYLFLYNHQTPLDQFFISIISGAPVYHVATEDIMSNGWISRLLEWCVAPIPILKQMKDLRAVKNVVTVARQGGSIAVAPEGNRTFSGRTTYFGIGIVKMMKLLKLPVVIVRIEGGYGVEPRWAGRTRKGPIRVYPAKVIKPEEYLTTPDEAVFEVLKKLLWVDESVPGEPYRSKRNAEYMERLFYVCPACGLSRFVSKADTVSCEKCGLAFRYTDNKELIDLSGKTGIDSIGKWYDLQERFVNSLDLRDHTREPLYTDAVSVSEVRLYEKKIPVAAKARALLYGDRIEIEVPGTKDPDCFPFEETDTVTVLGKKKINIYHAGRVVQIAGGDRFNALKYVNMYYRYLNIIKAENGGEGCVKFLGL